MRRVFYALLVVCAVSVVASPREEPRTRNAEKGHPVLKMVKKVVRALGDGLTIPTPKKP